MLQQTIDKLYKMRLGGMARGIEEQLTRGGAAELSFEERLTLVVDQEWQRRQNQSTERRIKNARLKQPACAADIDYQHPRGLDRVVVQDILTCNWIRAHHNLIITGATGLGKTWLASAFADQACRLGLTATYHRLPRLVHELAIARADGSYLRQLVNLSRVDLLMLDDWALSPLDSQAQHDILEVLDDRAGKGATLVTSQIPTSKWHAMIADPSVADALLDRLLGTAQQITLKDAPSMRKTPRR